jgi:hypothetical protein
VVVVVVVVVAAAAAAAVIGGGDEEGVDLLICRNVISRRSAQKWYSWGVRNA